VTYVTCVDSDAAQSAGGDRSVSSGSPELGLHSLSPAIPVYVTIQVSHPCGSMGGRAAPARLFLGRLGGRAHALRACFYQAPTPPFLVHNIPPSQPPPKQPSTGNTDCQSGLGCLLPDNLAANVEWTIVITQLGCKPL
jgi:hypothetical protein